MKQKTGFLLILFHIWISVGLTAQEKKDFTIVQTSQDELNRNFEEQIISIQGEIREVVIDSANGRAYLSVQTVKGSRLKKEGFVVSVDLNEGTLFWKKEFKYDNSDSELNLELSPEGIPFVIMKYNAFGLDPESGSINWTFNSDDFRLHPNRKFFLANELIKVMTFSSTETGELIWRRDMNFKDTQNVNFTSDSCMVVIEKGIHHVDLTTGNAWFTKIKGLDSFNPMSQGGRTGIVAGSTAMFGLLGGLIAAAATSSSSSASMVGSKTRNYLFEEDAIYIAAEYLAKYSHDNTLLWKEEDLSKKRGVSSIISLNDDDFLLVDFGYRNTSDGLKVRSGDASCEFISKKTGELYRGIMLRTEGDDYIKDFVLEDKTISFLGKRTLFTISLETLETVSSTEFGGAYTNIGLSKFVDPNDYKKLNEKFVQLSSISEGSLLIRNTANKVVEFDENLDLIKVYSANEFYEQNDEYKDYRLICNSDECLLIDAQTEELVKSNLSRKALFTNGFLVDYDRSDASVLNLN